MTTTVAIRKKLHAFIDNIEEKKLKAIYTLFKEEINAGERIGLDVYNEELKEAEAEYTKGIYLSQKSLIKKVKKW